MESYDICLLWLAYFIDHNVLRVHSYCRISFLLNTESYPTVCTCDILLIRSSVSEHLGCFFTLWIMMLWTWVFNYLFKIKLSVHLGLCSEVGCWSCGNSNFSFLRNAIFLQQGYRFTFPPWCTGASASPHPVVAVCCFLKVTILMGVRWYLILVICTSLIPGLGRSPGEGNGKPFQYSCLGESHGQRSL